MTGHADQENLLDEILSRLGVERGPDRNGNYMAWCVFHDDGKGQPPHNPNLSVSLKGFYCHACKEKGSLWKLAKHLGVDMGYSDPEKTYDYVDESGNLLYQVVRKPGKRFFQRRPDGKDGWIWNLNGVTRVLYRYPELLAKPSERVFIVEGEGDVETLMAVGLLATTNSGGAGKWQDSYSDTLKDRDVVILPDNDLPGGNHGKAVAISLQGKAKAIRIVNLPSLKDKGDVTDWLTGGHTKEELLALCEAAPIFVNTSTVERRYLLTDLGNAERMADRKHDKLRFCYPTNQWHIYNGAAWLPDQSGQIRFVAQDIVREIMHEKVETNDPSELKKAISLQSHIRINAMVEECKPMLSFSPTAFDNQPMLLNCQNGVVDLTDGNLLPHDPTLMLSKFTPIEYDPKAKAPQWLEFIDQIMLGNEKLKSFLQRMSGLALTGDTQEQYFYILYGAGDNGKTTFVECLRKVLGSYAIATPAEGITIRQWGGKENSHQMARLPGIRLATVSETEKGQQLAESLIKQFTGGGEISAEMKYGHPFSFRPIAKLWIETNHKPVIRGRDHAIWRRVLLIPFLWKVDPFLKDKEFINKLIPELSGILNWAVQGCLDWRKYGLLPPDEVLHAVSEYQAESDILGDFINEHFIIEDGGMARSSEIRQLYIDWCKVNDEEVKSATWLGKAMGERFEKVNIGHGNERGYKGLRVKAMKDSLGF